MSFWSPSAWCRPATASVCHSLSQQPGFATLHPNSQTANVCTLYPNSQTVSVCHSLSQQPDCQRLPLFIPTAMPPLGTGLHRRLGFVIEVVSPRSILHFTNGLGTFRDRSILRAMVSFVHRVVTLIHMELLPSDTWSWYPYSHLPGCTASG